MSEMSAIISSATFWHQTMVFGVLALLCFIALVYLTIRAARRNSRRPSAFFCESDGAAEAVDLVLTFPIALAFMFMLVQFVLAANASLIVHYAAFAAARSARVAMWERSPTFIQGFLQDTTRITPDTSINNAAGQLFLLMALNQSNACQRASDAARLVLVAAAPSSIDYPFKEPGSSGCAGSTAWASAPNYIARIQQLVPRASAEGLQNKMRFAFSPSNTTVEVGGPNLVSIVQALRGGSNHGRIDSLPVTATVTFRFEPILPLPSMASLFDIGPDGRRSYSMKATVEVL
jgi:hypothetical protein